MNIVYEKFPSIRHLLKTINGRENNEIMRNENASKRTGGYDFTRTENWEEAMSLLENGYTDILGDLKIGMRENAKFQEGTRKRNMQTSVHGVAPHVPNAILGLPNAMINYETTIQKSRAISLIYSETANAGEDAESFVKGGIAILSTVHALEIRGFRVNLKGMFFAAKRGDDRAFVTVNLKDYREHLDLHKLCFPIAHPSMFRRIGFRWLETVPGLQEDGWSHGYGRSIQADEISEIDGIVAPNEYILSLHTIQECDHDVNKIIQYLNLK